MVEIRLTSIVIINDKWTLKLVPICVSGAIEHGDELFVHIW